MKHPGLSWIAGPFAAALALSAAPGCGPAAVENTPVVVIVPPPATVATAAPTAEPVRHKIPSSLIGIHGVWEDLETMSRHTIEEVDGELTVTAVIDDDGTSYPIRTSRFDGKVLRWSYFVPSTKYTVHLSTERLEGDTLWCHWSNKESKGTQEFSRVK